MDTVKVPLSKPIKAYDEDLKELSLRKPTGTEIRTIGFPFKMEITKAGTQIQHFNLEVVAAYAAALGNVPPSSIDQIEPSDWPMLAGMVSTFFGASTPEPSSGDTTS